LDELRCVCLCKSGYVITQLDVATGDGGLEGSFSSLIARIECGQLAHWPGELLTWLLSAGLTASRVFSFIDVPLLCGGQLSSSTATSSFNCKWNYAPLSYNSRWYGIGIRSMCCQYVVRVSPIVRGQQPEIYDHHSTSSYSANPIQVLSLVHHCLFLYPIALSIHTLRSNTIGILGCWQNKTHFNWYICILL